MDFLNDVIKVNVFNFKKMKVLMYGILGRILFSDMGWHISRSSATLKCQWLLFSNALNCPSISLAPRMLVVQCPIDQAEMGGK